jgi:hypothetical protein
MLQETPPENTQSRERGSSSTYLNPSLKCQVPVIVFNDINASLNNNFTGVAIKSYPNGYGAFRFVARRRPWNCEGYEISELAVLFLA